MKLFSHRLFTTTFLALVSISSVFAEDPVLPAGSAPVGAAPQQPGFLSMVFPFLLMFGVMYLLVIRPQKKRMTEQQKMLSELKKNDDIVTTSGILGKVMGITDKVVTIEVDDKVHVKMLKSQIAQVVKGGELKEISQA